MGELNLKIKPKERENVLTESSRKPGLAGLIETFLRRSRTFAFGLYLMPLAVLCSLCLGAAAAPGVFVFEWVSAHTLHWWPIFRYAALGCGVSMGYFAYGFSLIFIVPLANFLMPFKLKAFRGPQFSIEMMPWYIHNALTYLVRYTFLDFITPSPFNILFYRMMGMKIGKGVVINTSNISDPCMITIEDHVFVGGSAHIFAHTGQRGYLLIEPLVIGRGTTVGLKASIIGCGTVIGENVTIRPHAVVLPRSRVPDGGTVE